MRKFDVVEGYEGKAVIPTRGSKYSAGYDFSIIVDEDTEIKPMERVMFHTGIKCIINDDEYLAIHVRSSIGIKKGVMLPNCTGIIDSDYASTGYDIGIPLINVTDKPIVIKRGVHRVAQGIIQKYLLTDDDSVSQQRIGGYGSTGN